MELRRLISASILYGLADMSVLLVSGFLLLPLYTHYLSKEEFGYYVVIRANTEFLSYLLYLGVPSAMARLYFDYRANGTHYDYIGTIVVAFTATIAVGAVLTGVFGADIWRLVAPQVPAWPSIWFCFGAAALSFYALVGTTWLRLDEAARAVVALQIGTAILIAVAASLSLAVFHNGLNGLLTVLMLASLPASVWLAWKLRKGFRKLLKAETIGVTLVLGFPIFLSYLSTFALNRINLFTLQHWIDIRSIAVFGLATQLASLVTVASMSFSKAVQPMIFRAGADDIAALFAKVSPLYVALMTLSAGLFVLYIADILALVAPASYGDALDVIFLLAFGNLINSFSLMSDSALMYFKKPKLSLAGAIVGSVASAVIGLMLVPVWGMRGAALALVIAFSLKTLASQYFAGRLVATSAVKPMLVSVGFSVVLFALVDWIQKLGLGRWTIFSAKTACILIIVVVLGVVFRGRIRTLIR
ncbi:lipopolysaccharide biosynthesis protein [Xanthobacter wiegelii]|uniref:lipopolysaccharide biosynthesis protein n=1 Tax=Xanthobacter wiegelii TaxID=3119913 RepID=UPI003727EAE5